jgi:parvulin-like peptidyl-prolyl isomerase
MNVLAKIPPIEPSEIVDFLKQELQFKKVWQQVLHRSVIEEAAEERDILVTSDEIQNAAEHFRRENRLEKASETQAWLQDQIITSEDWEVGIQNRLLKKKLADHIFAKEVEKFFAQNKSQFTQVLLYQIIVPYENLARELFYQIEEGEISFYQAAHLYDIDEDRRQRCGFEGKLYRRQLHLDIAAAVFGATLGQLVNPIKTAQGYHLLMVEEFIAAELTPERYQEIQDRMFEDWLTSELNYRIYSQS